MKTTAPSLEFDFDEKKATQVAARVVAKKGGEINYLLLMKMLYTIDRISLENWGQPVIGGHYCAMRKGPVISEVYDLIKGAESAGGLGVWSNHLATNPKRFELHLKKAAGTDELSEAEVDLVDFVFAMLGHRDKWSVVKWTHSEFREWKDPGETSKPIPVEDILKAVDKSEEEIENLAWESSYHKKFSAILGR